MHFRYCLLIVLFPLFALDLSAQDCQYQLRLEDSRGDGWNGGELTVRVAGVATVYTLTAEDNEEGDLSVFFPVENGDAVVLDYTAGAFPEETSFSLFDNADSLLYRTGPSPATGTGIFSVTANCKSCVPPAFNSIDIFRVRSTTADVRFNTVSPQTNPLYLIEYGAGTDFDPEMDSDGTLISTPDTSLRVTDLVPDRPYVFWISTVCQTEGDTTGRRGPFQIMTQKRADIGITELLSPVTACALGNEEVTIGITNFGGEPQAFFNVDFSINGQPSGVGRPQDGIFTGVVGVDSTEYFTFDATAGLSEPGTYTIAVWTELEDDEDTDNDTMEFTVLHVPLIAEFPYAENFEESDGFWYTERGGRGNSSWRWGTPFAAFIDQAPNGDKAWVTNPGGDYNDNELSYLLSPCFDYREQTSDAYFSALLQVQTELSFDAAWVEMTIDSGATWTKVRNSPAGINWYNDLENQRWTGDGNNGGDGAFIVANLLDGTAGEAFQLRFVFESSRSDTEEGILVDAVSISPRVPADLVALNAFAGSEDCGSNTESVILQFTNIGSGPSSPPNLFYRVNGGPKVEEQFGGTVNPGEIITYTFATTFDASANAENLIEVGIDTFVVADSIVTNNLTNFTLLNSLPLPFYEDFTNSRLPAGWRLTSDGIGVSDSPDLASPALIGDLGPSGADTLSFRTASYGPIATGDLLSIDLGMLTRGGSSAPDSAALTVFVFVDCSNVAEELSSFVIAGDTTVRIALDAYAGSALSFEVVARQRSGDFSLFFDNLNVARCPEALGLIANVVGVSAIGEEDAIVTVTPTQGLPPYDFAWSTGDSTMTVDGLGEGMITVTVTDAVGCQDMVEFTVDMSVSADDPQALLAGMAIFPNPTRDLLRIAVDLSEPRAWAATLYDLTGRTLLHQEFGQRRRLNEVLDLQVVSTGVYLLRIQAGDATRTIRVVRQ